jgi:hypothetical protein
VPFRRFGVVAWPISAVDCCGCPTNPHDAAACLLLQIVWVFRVQDTPGYGDDQDISKHIELIVEHIQANNIKWLEMENAKDRCV